MKISAPQIAQLLEGTIEGDSSVEVNRLSKIEEGTLGSLTFLANPKYTPYIYTTKASIVIVNNDFEPNNEVSATLIKVPDAYQAFTKLLTFYNQQKGKISGISKTAIYPENQEFDATVFLGEYTIIGNNVTLGKNVKIHHHVVIEDNVTIGEGSVIQSNCVIHADTKIGASCYIDSGCVLGSEGFGFAPNKSGSYDKIPQTGNLVIEDAVDIGANSTLDRATLGSTIIRKGVKLDNHIQIAHNVEVGENTVIAAQSGIAGSSKIGKNCIIGGQVGIIGHLKIGDNVSVQGQSGITSNIDSGATIYGTPGIDYKNYLKSFIYFKRFPALVKRIEAIEKEFNNVHS